MDEYQQVYTGLWLILSTIIIQAIILIRAHRKQKSYKVGVMDASLGQDSFLFRAYRTFWNSLENIVPIFGMSIIAIMVDYTASVLTIIVWVYAISRIIHMFLYYIVATDRNPSIRSVFYITGFLANVYLMVDLGVFLVL